MSYILLDKAGRQVFPGSMVWSRNLSRPMYVTGHSDRSVFVVRDPEYPKLHAQAFSPDVFGLRIEERNKD